MTEEELIHRAAAGDERAANELYRLYGPRLVALTRQLSFDSPAAEDYAQDAWLSALRALPGYRHQCAFWTWLYRIAMNAVRQGHRSGERRRSREDDFVRDATPARDSNPLLMLELRRALAELPEGMRAVLLLYDVHGFSHPEISERFGISVSASRSQLARARLRLRARLGTEAA